MIPSQRQIDIYDCWENEDYNIVINAVAGSGKTTTLLNLLEKCEYKTLFLAFNKSVQEEIQAKMDAKGLLQGKALTMHGMGLSAVRNKYRKIKINNGKNFDILKKVQNVNKRILETYPWKDRLKISYTLMDMNDISRMFLTTDVDEIKSHMISMDKMLFEFDELNLLWNDMLSIREEYYQRTSVEIDFLDMVFLPVHRELYIPIDPYYLMIDEAQDLNLCQHELINNLLKQGTVKKWIAVGDKNQSIYGFGGSSSSSFDLFSEKPNVKTLPLDICYRCDTMIIDAANEVYNVMQYFSGDKGIVTTIGNPNMIKENSMVVCRNSAPLIDLYFRLLSLEKNCFIKGEDILKSIVRFLTPYKSSTVGAAKMQMENKLSLMTRDNSDNGKYKYFVFSENYENFQKLANYFAKDHQTVALILNKLKSLFIDKEDAIMLCTIHKSKGLEADVVYILNENLIPSKFAKSSEQLQQEQNLKYVARTRAKKEMYYLNI